MKIVAKMDEGDLLAQGEYNIEPDETIQSLTDNLVDLSNQLLDEIIPKYLEGEIAFFTQDEATKPTYSRLLTKQDGQIDWTKPANQLEREVRAYLGWPGSYTELNDTRIVITKAKIIDQSGKPGQHFIHEKQLAFYCGQQALLVEKLKPAGKPEMDSVGFVNGYL